MDKNKALDKAKIGLLSIKNSVFISTVLFSLKFSWEEDKAKCPTAQTCGLTLQMNPDFFMKLNKEERIFLLAHEAWHVAFQHMSRLDDRRKNNFGVWNQATDHYINLMLLSKGYKMPSGGLANAEYSDQSEWSSDKIFEDLMKNPNKQDPQFQPDMSPATGDGGGKSGDKGGMSQEEVEQKIEDILVKASVQSRMAGDKPGSIPGDIEVALERLLNPKLPWSTILANFLNSMAKEDYSFRRPNKRFMPDVILPSLYSESLGHVAIAVDTSCSVSDKQFTAFRTEIDHIQRNLQPESMTVVDFDTRIHKIHKVKRGDDVSHIKFKGRGGTNIHPVFEHYNKRENEPKVLIVFSDLECREVTQKPRYPVIWIKLRGRGFDPTFGKVIDFDVQR